MRGEKDLNITVVPDSGTGSWRGSRAAWSSHIDDGRHDYEFDYTLPGMP